MLAASTESLDANVIHSCGARRSFDLKSIRIHYHRVMDDWQSLQWLRAGPAERFLRYYRFQIWPDRHGTVARQIRKLLRDETINVLDEKRFVQSSVAIQGLPAMEWLLFEQEQTDQAFVFNGSPTFRCHFLKAISANLKNISSGLLADWGGYYKEAITNPGVGSDLYATPIESASVFLSQLSTQLTFIFETKLQEPLGLKNEGDKTRLKYAESWRSARSLNNVLQNLRTLYQVYTIVMMPLLESKELHKSYRNSWESTIRKFEALPKSLQLAHLDHQQKLLESVASVLLLQKMITSQLNNEIKIPISFNELDGD